MVCSAFGYSDYDYMLCCAVVAAALPQPREAAALAPDPASSAALVEVPGAHDYHMDNLTTHRLRRSKCDWIDVVHVVNSSLRVCALYTRVVPRIQYSRSFVCRVILLLI